MEHMEICFVIITLFQIPMRYLSGARMVDIFFDLDGQVLSIAQVDYQPLWHI